MSGAVTLRVARDLEELSGLAAAFSLRCCQASITARGRCVVALSGGSTPRMLYTLLGRSPFLQEIDWARVHLFWGDERCVPVQDSQSNYRLVAETLLASAPLPKENIHRVPVELGDPQAVAASYETHVRDFFGLREGELPAFDLVLLGMGADGHTASLFPESPALEEQRSLVVAVYAEALQSHRTTFTLPVLNHARRVTFLVAGADKRDSLQRALAGDLTLPAARVAPTQGQLRWFVDRAAMGRA